MKNTSTKKQQGSVHIIIISVIVVAIIGALSFLLIQNLQNKGEVADTTTQPAEYVRTTTVPTDWKTFTSDKYKVSISYSSDWCVKIFDNQPDHATIGLTEIREGSCDLAQSYLVAIDIHSESLDEIVNGYKNDTDDPYTVISEKKIVFDGYDAAELRFTDDSDESNPKQVQKGIFVNANGYTYTLLRIYETDREPPLDFELTAEEGLTILESIKITD
jgi:hypothetical protein